MSRAAGLDDDVVYDCQEAWVANQREPERVALLIVVPPFAEGDDVVCTEGVDNGRDRIDWNGRRWLPMYDDGGGSEDGCGDCETWPDYQASIP